MLVVASILLVIQTFTSQFWQHHTRNRNVYILIFSMRHISITGLIERLICTVSTVHLENAIYPGGSTCNPPNIFSQTNIDTIARIVAHSFANATENGFGQKEPGTDTTNL